MKKQRFLFTLLMAVVMMAFSPTIAWAQEDGGDPDPGYEVLDDESQECQHETLVYEHYESNVHQELCYTCGHCLQEEECSFVNGKCTKCNYECVHEWDNSRCAICNIVCTNHTYNTKGACTTCGATCEIVSVTIGENTVRYESLSDALTAALNTDPATITLLQNFTQNASISISQGNVTLDLNGHTISTIEGVALKLSGGSLTIMDSGNTGEINTTVGYAVYATGGTITIHGGKFKTNSGPAFYVDNSGVNVSIDGGRFTGDYAIYLGGKSALAPGYSYYITDTDTELADVTSGPVRTPESNFATDITVKPATVKATLTIGGETTNYYDFKKAFDDALEASSATITMLGDVSLSSPLTVAKGNVTLDLNGHTISTSGPNTLNLSGGSLTIKDSSVGKTGTMKTSGSNALNVTGGSITIQGGTFSASGYALNITSSNVTASLEGGVFKASGGGINNQSGKSILAEGYSFYNSNDDELPERTTGYILEGNYSAKDITVKPATVKGTLTIGGETTNYYDFKKAFDDALEVSSATITMLGDVSLSSSLTVDKGNVTLDLNGHTISTSGPNTLNLSGGSLTIKDSSVGKTGTMETSGSYALNVTGGSITIQGGTFSASGSALNITSSNVTASLECGIFKANTCGIYNQSGKSILADGYAFYNSNDEELPERTNGYILEGNYSVKDITVKPATVKATLTIGGETTNYYDLGVAFGKALDAGSAVTMTIQKDVDLVIGSSTYSLDMDRGNLTLDLNGHSIKRPNGNEILKLSGGSLTIVDSSVGKTGLMQINGGYALNVTGGSLTIHGGTFCSYNSALYITSTNVTASLDGGIFKANISGIYNESGKSILAEGYSFYSSNNELDEVVNGTILEGNYPAKDITVKPATVKGTLTIGGETTNYYHFKKAFDDALEASSATITMLGDVSLSSSLTVNKGNVTLDLNGHTISTSGPNTLNLSGGSLTIKDSSVGKTGTMKTSGSYALNVTGGSISILGGTFSASSYALNITSSNVTASLEGGVFKASGGGGINNQSGKSILADGYAFYNSNDEELPERTTDYILEGNDPARDITVKPATVKATLTIGGETTNYYTFMTAFNAALNSTSPATMTLLADVDLYAINNRSPKTLEFDKGNVTLDLNGHSIIEPIGGNILNISAGSLTITDGSADKTGKMQTEIGNVINVSGGSLTVLEGTFITTSNNLYISSTTATVTLKGGRFQTKSTSDGGAAVYNNSGKSILADGFAFYNALTGIKLNESRGSEIMDEEGNVAHDVIVECDHKWNDNTCSKCGKVHEHNFDSSGKCKICGRQCTHEGAECDQENPAYVHYCKTCGLYVAHNFDNSVCTVCGYQCVEHQWDDSGTCSICYTDCNHQYSEFDDESHICSICSHSEHHSWCSDGYCVRCGSACEHVWVWSNENDDNGTVQCSICGLAGSFADPCEITDATPLDPNNFYRKNEITYTRGSSAPEAGSYATFCMPFDVDLSEAACIGTAYVPLDVAFYNEGTGMLNLFFHEVNGIIPAGTPFVARMSGENIVLKNCTKARPGMVEPELTNISVFNYTGTAGLMLENESMCVTFGGALERLEGSNFNTFNTNGSFGRSSYVSPFRVFVEIEKDGPAEVKAVNAIFGDEDNMEDYIEAVKAGELPTTGEYYTIDGLKTSQPKGLYIYNGKKYLKK